MRENNNRRTIHCVKVRLSFVMAGLLVLVLFAVIGLSGCASSSKNTYHSYSGTVTVSLGLGKESVLLEENPFPVTVHIEGDYAVQGSWCVLTVPTNASDYYTYWMPLSDEKSQKVTFIVPAAKYSSQLTLEVRNSDKRVIYSRTSTYQARDKWQDLILIGQMGTQTDSISWPEEIKHDELGNRITVQQVILTEDNFYTQKEGYEMLDFLVVDASFFKKLDSAVQNALLEWVKEGGTIAFQGSDAWTTIQSLGFTHAKNYSAGTNITLLYCNYASGSMWSVGDTLSQTVARLTDSHKEKLLKALSKGQSGGYSDNYTTLSVYDKSTLAERISCHKTSAETPNIWIYVILLCVYLGVGIPCVYIIVRKRKRIRWFRPLVCVLAVSFSFVIFLLSAKTRYSRPFLRSMTLISDENCSDDTISETVYMGIQAPFNSRYEVSLNPDYKVTAIQGGYYWGSGTQNGIANARHVADISLEESQTLVAIENLTAFSSRYFCLETNKKSFGQINGTVSDNETGLSGSITNNTSYKLYSVIVNAGEQLALIDSWNPGETIDLEAGQKEGTVHMMTLTQYEDGAYKNRGAWDASLSDYYEYFLYTKADQNAVMARIDYTPQLQKNTEYPVENDTIVRLSVQE